MTVGKKYKQAFLTNGIQHLEANSHNGAGRGETKLVDENFYTTLIKK